MKKLLKKFHGLRTYRFKENPVEKALAHAWAKLNHTESGLSSSTLAHLLNEQEDQRYPKEPSDRDWLVANTIIQWLGTPVGQNFLLDVLLKNKSLIKERWSELYEKRED